MKVEIISIGDELLIGQTVNTNASWMGEQLSRAGLSIEYCTVVRDDPPAMLNAFAVAMGRVDIVLVTGGLGPTKDDITKEVLAQYFAVELVQNEEVLNHVRNLFESRGRAVQDVNLRQALVPEGCTVLQNTQGTAPGMWLERDGKILVSMPGVPYEMKYIMQAHVLPMVSERFRPDSLYYRTLLTQGIAESILAERIEDLETGIRAEGFGLAYLPSPGLVRLRISGPANDAVKERIEYYFQAVQQRIPQYAFGEGEVDLPEVVGTLLRSRGMTLSTAESCTGGALATAIVSVSGSSDYFQGSIVSYSNQIKQQLLQVSPESLKSVGAVSKEVVEQMAMGGRKTMGTDYCIALSGIAGPDGGSVEKPVGTVWIGIAGPNSLISKVFRFELNRQRNIQRAVLTALNLLRCEILEINFEKS